MSESTSPAEPDAQLLRLGYQPALGRRLGMVGVLTYGLLFFVPMAPVAVFGYVVNLSGGVPVLVYLVAAAIMSLSAVSFREMALRFPVAGSVYGYTRLSTHPHLGFVAGWLILLDYLLMPATLVVLAAIALNHLLTGVPVWVIVVGFVVASLALNLAGITITTRAGVVMLAVQLAALALFGIFVARAVLAGNVQLTGAGLWRPGTDVGAVLGAVSMAALSYLGFDAVNTLNEEARGGGRTVGIATVALMALVTALFAVTVFAASCVAPVTGFPEGGDTSRAFYHIVDAVSPAWFGPVFTLTSAVLAIFSCLMVAHASTARLLFAMARDGLLPRTLAGTSGRGIPAPAVTLVAGLSLLLGLALADHSTLATSLVTFGALSSYVLLHVSVIERCWRREHSGAWLRHLVIPLVAIVSLVAALSQTAAVTKAVGLGWLALGLAGYAVVRARGRGGATVGPAMAPVQQAGPPDDRGVPDGSRRATDPSVRR